MRGRIITSLVLLALSTTAWAGSPFVGFDLGFGDLDISEITVSPGFDLNSAADGTAIYHVTGGYEFDNGFVIIGAFEEFESISLFGFGDAIELKALKLGAGFAAPMAERFRLTGTVGLASWDLEARESFLFNPGPEATGGLDDTDFYFDIGFEWLVNDQVRVPITFNYNDYDFGDSIAWRAGIRFSFK